MRAAILTAEMMRRRSLLQSAPGVLAAAAGYAQMPPPKSAAITSSVMLWTLKGTFDQKLEIAAKAGLQSVELVGEYTGWTDSDIARVKRQTRSLKLGMDTRSATPCWKKMPISMVDPAQRANLLKEVQRNIVFAKKLKIPMLILMSGMSIPGRPRREQWASLVEGCKRCGELAAKAGVTLVVEPLNSKLEVPGFFLTTCGEGLKLIREVDNPHVRLLFDIYHEQVQTGNIIRTIRRAAPYTAIFHVADNPGRHEPGSGEINYPNVYKAIGATGYKGYITMEYLPVKDPVRSLIAAVDQMRASI